MKERRVDVQPEEKELEVSVSIIKSFSFFKFRKNNEHWVLSNSASVKINAMYQLMFSCFCLSEIYGFCYFRTVVAFSCFITLSTVHWNCNMWQRLARIEEWLFAILASFKFKINANGILAQGFSVISAIPEYLILGTGFVILDL